MKNRKSDKLTCGQDMLLNFVQFSKTMSVPFLLTVAWIWGQNPVVLVKHHSPQLAQPQLLVKVVLTVWHMTGSGSIPAWKALEINCAAVVNILPGSGFEFCMTGRDTPPYKRRWICWYGVNIGRTVSKDVYFLSFSFFFLRPNIENRYREIVDRSRNLWFITEVERIKRRHFAM